MKTVRCMPLRGERSVLARMCAEGAGDLAVHCRQEWKAVPLVWKTEWWRLLKKLKELPYM